LIGCSVEAPKGYSSFLELFLGRGGRLDDILLLLNIIINMEEKRRNWKKGGGKKEKGEHDHDVFQ
jgi:hypothetical protein